MRRVRINAMRLAKRWLFRLLAAGLIALIFPANAGAKFDKRELRVPGQLLWNAFGDVDGDRLTDIVVSYRRGSGPAAERFMAVFFRRGEGYPARPDVAFKAPKNAAVFDLGDAIGDAAEELVYLAQDGVYAQVFADRKPGAPTKIIDTRTLVGSAEEEDLAAWDLFRPIAPKKIMVIVPTGGYLDFYERQDVLFKRIASVDVHAYSYYDAERATYRRSRRGGSSGRAFALRVTTVIPSLSFVDQTGDGRADLVTTYEDRFVLFPGQASGGFAPKASFRRWFKLRTEKEDLNRDNEISMDVLDLDGDGIADLSATKIGGGLMNLSTETRIYRGIKGGGFKKEPSQIFRDEGFASLVEYIDIDGDGRLEMVQPEAQVSILAMSKVLFSSELSIDLRVRRPTKEDGLFFGRSPAQTLRTVFGLDFSVGGSIQGNYPLFGHDFDGDKKPDTILAQGRDKMVLHRGLGKPSEIFEEDGSITLSGPATTQTFALSPRTDREVPPDVLLIYRYRAEQKGKMLHFFNER